MQQLVWLQLLLLLVVSLPPGLAAAAPPAQTHHAPNSHPDLAGLLDLKASICGPDCAALSSWAPNGSVCASFDGVYCGFVLGAWRVVGVQLQLEVVALEDAAMAGSRGIRHLRELELLCVHPHPPPPSPGPTPSNPLAAFPVLSDAPQQQQQHLADTSAAGMPSGLALSRQAAVMQSQQTQQQQLPAAAPTSPGSSSSSAAFERQRHRQHHNAAGELPGSWFVAFPSLAHLRVVGCGARGALHKLPLTAAKHLTSLVLSHNKLAGSLPEHLAQLQALSVLDLSNNALAGPLPPAWAGMPELQYLYLSSNNLSGVLPCEYTSLQLRLADLSGNHWHTAGLQAASTAAAADNSIGSAVSAGALRAPNCWLRRYCYDEGAFICLRRGKRHSLGTGGCSSYVYGASDLHIDPANQCDHGGPHLAAIVLMFSGFFLVLVLLWLHHCRLLRRMQHLPGGSGSQRQQEQAGPWNQRHWRIVNGPSRPRTRSLGLGGSSEGLGEPLLQDQQQQQSGTLPLLYCAPSSQHEGAGYASPVASGTSAFEGAYDAGLVVGTPDAALPSALTTPSAGAISLRPPPQQQQPGLGRGSAGSRQGRVGAGAGSSEASTGRGSRQRQVSGSRSKQLIQQHQHAESSSGYDSDASSGASGRAGGQAGGVALSASWLQTGYHYFHGNEPLPPWAGGVARLLAAVSPGADDDNDGTAGCFRPALLLPLVAFALDAITNARLLLLWGLGPPAHVKLWPSYVLLGFLVAPHVLVGAVVHFRLLALASLPPQLKAAASPAGLVATDVLPPGSAVLTRAYTALFVAPSWLAYPLILVLLLPGVLLMTLLVPLTLPLAACGLGGQGYRSVERYVQLLQGCAALTQSPGSAVLLTVLFLMGNVPLEWAFLNGALFYVTVAADLANIGIAWWLRLQGARQQQALTLAALRAETGQQWT